MTRAPTAAERVTADDVLAGEASIDAIAARDDRPGESGGPDRPRWTVPLVDLIGDQEPDDDDSEDWIIRDVIPRGESSLIAGPPKGGKSYAMLDLALSIATGTPWLGGAAENTLGRPGRVLVLALEDSVRRLRSRLWKLARGRGTTPNDPLVHDNFCVTRAPVRIPDRADLRAFRDELARWRPDAVLIDCLARVMVGDESDATTAKEYASAVTSICVDLGIAIATLHHTRKPSGEDKRRYHPLTLDDIRGSGDLVASARHVVIWQVLPVPERHIARLYAGGNLDVRTEERAIELVSEDRHGRISERMVDCGDVESVLAAIRREGKEEAVAQRDAEAQRRELQTLRLAAERGQVSTSALAVIAGIPERTATRVIAGLVERGHLERASRTAPATITDAGRAALTGDQ